MTGIPEGVEFKSCLCFVLKQTLYHVLPVLFSSYISLLLWWNWKQLGLEAQIQIYSTFANNSSPRGNPIRCIYFIMMLYSSVKQKLVSLLPKLSTQGDTKVGRKRQANKSVDVQISAVHLCNSADDTLRSTSPLPDEDRSVVSNHVSPLLTV